MFRERMHKREGFKMVSAQISCTDMNGKMIEQITISAENYQECAKLRNQMMNNFIIRYKSEGCYVFTNWISNSAKRPGHGDLPWS